MNSHGLFITGTGTEVGKTFASGFLLTLLKDLGRNPLYYKPIQCGPAHFEEREFPEGDTEFMRKVIGHAATANTWLLRNASSPHLAFACEEVTFDAKPIHSILLSSRKDYDFIVVEGAGGIRVPNTDKIEMTDIAKLTLFPIMVVAHPGLGTINHTLLTLEHLPSRHLPIAGFLFCQSQATQDALAADNAHVIQARSGIPFLGTIPRWNKGWKATDLAHHPLREYLALRLR